MTTNPTDHDPAATSTWMSDHTIAELQEKHVELIGNARKYDELTADARREVLDAERKLQVCQDHAAGVRIQIEENQTLLAIAQGHAPRPHRTAIAADGLNLMFGVLRLAGLPAGATRDDYATHAELMRAIYCAALDIADRADKAAANAPLRRWTPDVHNENGSTTIKTKRACNGCGDLLGDITVEEYNASVEGRPLPDVRDECARCNGTAEQPITANGAEPLTMLSPTAVQDYESMLNAVDETITDLPAPADGGEGQC